MQAGHSVLVTGFTARLPVRPGPARPAARAPLPSPPGDRARPRAGRHASREKPGTGPHDTAGRHGTRRRGPHARAGNPSCRTSVQFRGLIDLDRGPQEVKSTPARRASANAPQPKTALRGCLPIGKWPSRSGPCTGREKPGPGRHSAPPANTGSIPYTCRHRKPPHPENTQAVPKLTFPRTPRLITRTARKTIIICAPGS